MKKAALLIFDAQLLPGCSTTPPAEEPFIFICIYSSLKTKPSLIQFCFEQWHQSCCGMNK
jgi:hypothetical protein